MIWESWFHYQDPLNSPDHNIVFKKLTDFEGSIPGLAPLRQFGLDYMQIDRCKLKNFFLKLWLFIEQVV